MEQTTQDKIKTLQQEYANQCFIAGDCTHKIDHFNSLLESTKIKLRNLEIDSVKLNQIFNEEKKNAPVEAPTLVEAPEPIELT